MKKAVVFGAGLVGSLWSLFLAKRGYRVDVFESRLDYRKNKYSGRSINLALSHRGLNALELVGLKSKVGELILPMYGRCVHAPSGETDFQPYGIGKDEKINSVGRGALTSLLVEEAEATGSVEFHFDQKLVSADLDQGRFEFQSGKALEFKGPVFGAEGVNSVLREEILRKNNKKASVDLLGHGYKELNIPGIEMKHKMRNDALHIWPRKSFMLIALPNLDGSFTATLFLDHKTFNGLNVVEFFETHFSDFVNMVPDYAAQFEQNPVGQMVTVRSLSWVGDNVVLIGDAAHGIVPFFGQGMNCGFEDCAVLNELWDESDLASTYTKYFESRKPNADSIAELALENFIEMRDLVSDPHFLKLKKIEKSLQERFPEYVSRYRLVSFSLTPYKKARLIGETQKEILEELARDEVLNWEKAENLITRKLGADKWT